MSLLYALSKGVAAAAKTGSDFAGQQLKEEAEARAADRKLQDAERLMAIQEAMENRAAERFASVVKQRSGEEVPLEAPGLAETGLTQGSAQAMGLKDGIQGDASTVNSILQTAKDTLSNPTATEAQKMQAQELIAQIEGQMGAQGNLNAKSVEGKTRKRTVNEAARVALEDTLLNDPAAYKAGKDLLYDKADVEAAKQEAQYQREILRQDRLDQRNREDNRSREAAAETRMLGMIERMASKKEDPYKFIGEIGKEIRSNRTQINALRRELIMARGEGDQDLASELQSQIDGINATNAKLHRNALVYAKESGINVPADLLEEEKPAAPAAQKTPAVGSVIGGYRYKGGDPKSPSSWEKS
jgi:hypothetical protein